VAVEDCEPGRAVQIQEDLRGRERAAAAAREGRAEWASSMFVRQPCMDAVPNAMRSFSPLCSSFSVTGALR